jgi:hypothetical protein
MAGRHTWEARVEHGEKYSVCSNCGKEKGGGSGGSKDAMRNHVWDRTGGG